MSNLTEIISARFPVFTKYLCSEFPELEHAKVPTKQEKEVRNLLKQIPDIIDDKLDKASVRFCKSMHVAGGNFIDDVGMENLLMLGIAAEKAVKKVTKRKKSSNAKTIVKLTKKRIPTIKRTTKK